jgi:hypothetical protein
MLKTNDTPLFGKANLLQHLHCMLKTLHAFRPVNMDLPQRLHRSVLSLVTVAHMTEVGCHHYHCELCPGDMNGPNHLSSPQVPPTSVQLVLICSDQLKYTAHFPPSFRIDSATPPPPSTTRFPFLLHNPPSPPFPTPRNHLQMPDWL